MQSSGTDLISLLDSLSNGTEAERARALRLLGEHDSEELSDEPVISVFRAILYGEDTDLARSIGTLIARRRLGAYADDLVALLHDPARGEDAVVWLSYEGFPIPSQRLTAIAIDAQANMKVRDRALTLLQQWELRNQRPASQSGGDTGPAPAQKTRSQKTKRASSARQAPVPSSADSSQPSPGSSSSAKMGAPPRKPSRQIFAARAELAGLPTTGQTLGECLLLERVGRGGSSVVFRAFHKALNAPVAVKVMAVQGSRLTEAWALARLRHPYIRRIVEFEDKGPHPYLVLEYVDGLSLQDLIRLAGPLQNHRAVRIMVKVCHALHYALEHEFLHRDLKPANILLTKKGVPRLADLGLASLVEDSAGVGTNLLGVSGTLAYLSPERLMGKGGDHRADIYSLGVTLYQTLTGQLPHKSGKDPREALQHRSDEVPAPHLLIPEIDPMLSSVTLGMFAYDQEDRPQSYEELIEELTPWEQPSLANLESSARHSSAALKRETARWGVDSTRGFLIGAFEDTELLECLSMLECNRKTGTLSVVSDHLEGTITVQDGKVIHARCGDAEDLDAIQRILSSSAGQFVFSPEQQEETGAPHETIPISRLLLEAMKERDETGRVRRLELDG